MTKTRTSFLLCGLVAAAALATGCASGDVALGPTYTHTTVLGAGPAVIPVVRQLPAADAAFALTAAGSGMYEVAAGRMAATRAVNGAVRDFGQMLVDHHTRASNELLVLMQSRGMTAPATLPAELQAKLTHLASLSGAAFDEAFIRIAGVQDHQQAIAQFEQAGRTLADADLQAWTVKTLPVLRTHLSAAQVIAGRLAG